MEEGDGVLVINDVSSDPRAILRPLISYAIIKNHAHDSVAHTRSFIRHDPQKIKAAIEELISTNI
jgi:DNA-directed RNA polymerase subunit F